MTNQNDIYPEIAQHGRMELVGFDVEGYALFRCPICGREVGLYTGSNENAVPIKFVAQGNFFAAHSAALSEDGIEIAIGGVETVRSAAI